MKWFTFLCVASLPLHLFGAPAKPVPNFSLINENGKKFSLYDLKGKHLLVSFIFTRCPMPTMCPLTIRKTKEVIAQWKSAKDAAPLRVLLVTLDPEYDTAPRVKEYLKKQDLDPKLVGAAVGNGTQKNAKTLEDLAAEFNVIGIPGGAVMSHNMKSILLDPEMVPVKEFKDNEWKPAEIVALLNLKSS